MGAVVCEVLLLVGWVQWSVRFWVGAVVCEVLDGWVGAVVCEVLGGCSGL